MIARAGYESKYGHGHILCYGCSDGKFLLHVRDYELAKVCCACSMHIVSGKPYTVSEDDSITQCGMISFEGLRVR